jgi:hypothetical protein
MARRRAFSAGRPAVPPAGLSIFDHARLEAERRQALVAAVALDAAGSVPGAREARLRAISLHVRARLNGGPRVAGVLDALTDWLAEEEMSVEALDRLIARLDLLDREAS